MFRFKTFLLITLAVCGCSEPSLTDENLTEYGLTRQFELQKGQMRPIQEYDSTVLSQNRSRPMYSTVCITKDQQIYICKKSSDVKSVCAGEVKKIIKSEFGIVVLVKSGKYLTVYRYLDTVTLDEGDLIDQGRLIGKTQPSDPFYFEVYKVGSKLNPSEWVKV